jgi:catechol 2,3-dioxygenase-like lactoylglutathione lyase family enzyme
MQAAIDHVVLWVEDPLRAVDFYERVVGLPGVRIEEFRAGQAPFPSVRVSEGAILDLMPTAGAPFVAALAGREGSAGHPVNHVCLAMSAADMAALRGRLEAAGIAISGEMEGSFGARGAAPKAFYFQDLDDNVLEARHYDAGR